MTLDQLWTEAQTAEYLGVAPKTLRKWRCTGERDLPFVKVGRTPRYRSPDVQAFVERNVVIPVAKTGT